MLQNAAKEGRPLTGAGLEAMVNGGYTYSGALPGGIGPNTFTQSENAAVPCAALVQVVGTEYKVVQPMSCYDNIKVP
jgi:hypothetical protein